MLAAQGRLLRKVVLVLWNHPAKRRRSRIGSKEGAGLLEVAPSRRPLVPPDRSLQLVETATKQIREAAGVLVEADRSLVRGQGVEVRHGNGQQGAEALEDGHLLLERGDRNSLIGPSLVKIMT